MLSICVLAFIEIVGLPRLFNKYLYDENVRNREYLLVAMKIAINFIMMYIRLMPAELQSEVFIYINVHLLQRIVLILNFIIVDIEKATCPPSLPPSISDINIFSLATIYIYLQLLFVRHIIRFHKF